MEKAKASSKDHQEVKEKKAEVEEVVKLKV